VKDFDVTINGLLIIRKVKWNGPFCVRVRSSSFFLRLGKTGERETSRS
jgi:hypothetical protein